MSIAAAFGLGGLAAGTQAASDLTNVLLGLYTNKQNIKEARRMFAMQAALANTAHQREVADLRAAGLNPILSSGTAGAPVPSQSAASASSPSIDGPAAIMNQMAQMKLNAASIEGDVQEQAIKKRFLKEHPEYIENKLILDSAPKNALETAYLAIQKGADTDRNNSANTANSKVLFPELPDDHKPNPYENQPGAGKAERYNIQQRKDIDTIQQITQRKLKLGEWWKLYNSPPDVRENFIRKLRQGESFKQVWDEIFEGRTDNDF